MMRFAIGVGCRRGASAEAIVRLVRVLLTSVDRHREERSDAAIQAAPGMNMAPHGSPRFARDDDAMVVEASEGRVPDPARALGLFSIDLKRHEPGLHDAARALRLPLRFLPEPALQGQLARVLTVSSRVMAATGVPSVAEAAALAGAGQGAWLLGPRQARAGVTCAVAIVDTVRP